MKKTSVLIAILLAVVTIVGCSSEKGSQGGKKDDASKKKQEIIISAAASLKETMEEIKKVYEKDNNVNLTLNFGASGALQKQIEEGAPVDIFISAGQKQFKALEEKNLIEEGSKKDIVENELVLIVNNKYKDKITSIEDLEKLEGHIALGEVGSVPAGQYAEESLNYYKKLDKLQDKIVYAKDVKQVVSYVESGEAVCGIVYKSDAMHIKESSIVVTFDTSSHKTISYPGGVIATSEIKEASGEFLDFLVSDKGKEILKQYGFKID
ncbi:molybdate ABC transporter substrate-binding protein [Clostridium sp.]|uniref:molybdate ABC transporter substrate-binding protein n=1 Tax=Clostridium sp. TaxID=1506 RepID=UPI0032171418